MNKIDIKAIAASIANELTEHPERWTQGAFSRNARGEAWAGSQGSVCWCAFGHIRKHMAGAKLNEETMVRKAFNAFLPVDIVAWNDAEGRTVADVIALCRKVAQEPAERERDEAWATPTGAFIAAANELEASYRKYLYETLDDSGASERHPCWDVLQAYEDALKALPTPPAAPSQLARELEERARFLNGTMCADHVRDAELMSRAVAVLNRLPADVVDATDAANETLAELEPLIEEVREYFADDDDEEYITLKHRIVGHLTNYAAALSRREPEGLSEAESALRELVACDDLTNSIDDTYLEGALDKWEAACHEITKRKVAAWAAARAILRAAESLHNEWVGAARALTEVVRWVPVEESLPKQRSVVVKLACGRVYGARWGEDGRWHIYINGLTTDDVTHWADLRGPSLSHLSAQPGREEGT